MPTVDRLISDTDRIHQWINDRSGLVRVRDFVGIAREVDGRIVAAVGYDHHQDWSASFHIAVTKHGLNRELLWRAFEVPFTQWDYRLLLGIVQVGNAASLNIARRLGFSQWGTLPEAHPSGSLEFFQMRREHCPWLEITRKNNERRRKHSQGPGPLEAGRPG